MHEVGFENRRVSVGGPKLVSDFSLDFSSHFRIRDQDFIFTNWVDFVSRL